MPSTESSCLVGTDCVATMGFHNAPPAGGKAQACQSSAKQSFPGTVACCSHMGSVMT